MIRLGSYAKSAAFILLLFMLNNIAAQNVGIGTTTPDASAMLDISATNKGLLIPRMTYAEITGIVAPAEGLMVYATSMPSGLYQYRSGNWERVLGYNGSITAGGLFFGLNSSSMTQDASHLFWNNTNKYLGIGTSSPNSPLTVSSLLSPTGNGGGNSWIVSSIGASTGARTVIGTREGQATIGATNQFLTLWDTLNLNPGAKLKFGNYTSSTTQLLGTKSNGAVINLPMQNGLKLDNDVIKFGGQLSENTEIDFAGKTMNLGNIGTLQMSAENVAFPIVAQVSTIDFGQSFTVVNTGMLNHIHVRLYTGSASFAAGYEIFEGNGFGGTVVQSGNITVPQFFGDVDNVPWTLVPININVTANSVYTVRIHLNGIFAACIASYNNEYSGGTIWNNSGNNPNVDIHFQLFETPQSIDLMKMDPTTKEVKIGNSVHLVLKSQEGTGNRNAIFDANGKLIAGSSLMGTVSNVTVTSPLQVTNGTSMPHITIDQASGATHGYLLSSDWTTFNNKQNALPNASSTASGILTNTDWTTFNNKQTALPNASSTASGILTNTDWTTFNNKQNALPNASSTSSGILTNTDWNTFNNKYNLPSLTNGSILFSNGSNITQNNTKLFWDNVNHALGINTSSPLAGLEISGYNWNNAFRISTQNASSVGSGIFLDAVERDFAIIATNAGAGAGSQKLGFYDDKAGQYRMVIDSMGNVGIGNVNPTHKMEVSGLGGFKSSSTHSGSGLVDWVAGNFGGNSNGSRVVMGLFDTVATVAGHNVTLDAWKNLALNPGGGNVGIGTTNPTQKLDVVGNIKTSGHVRQAVYSHSVLVPGATYPVINPITGGPTTPTYGESTLTWVHNLGYNPVIMTSFEFVLPNQMHHVQVSYRHADMDTIEFYFSNQAVSPAQGTMHIIVVN